jgi:hypothetical protein
MLQLRGQPHGQLPGLQQVERGKSGACKASAQPTHPDQRCCRPPRRKRSGPATAIRRAGEPWIWLEPCCRVVKATLPTPPEPAPRSVTGNPQKDKMTELNTGSNAANPVLKATKALGKAQVTSTKVKSGKSSPKNPNPTKPIPPPQSVKSLAEEISDLLDTLPLGACVELTRRLLTAAPTLAGRPQNRCPICSRIWQHDLEGRTWWKLCGWPAGMPMVFAAGSWNWKISSASTESIYVCWQKLICERETSFGLQTMFVTEQTGPQREAGQQYWSVGL